MYRDQALNKLLFVVSILLFLIVAAQAAPAQTHSHVIQVEVLPGLKMIKAQDTLTFPKGTAKKLSFLLHKDLVLQVQGTQDKVQLLHAGGPTDIYSEYGLTLGNEDHQVTLSYVGVIHDPVVDNESRGLVSAEGATLFGQSYWYPVFPNQQLRFDVTVKVPDVWQSFVQGQMTRTEIQGGQRLSQFVEIYPQEDIYLIAGPFSVYEKSVPSGKKLQVLLRKSEPQLAQSFLDVLPEYLDHYSAEIGAYPYSQFAVVENFWETGYGMPSFTLLGPQVIRFPFILTSSLPHEVLHNWWGNSVYVDYDNGNWSEGLTTYMSDYWQQEKLGRDSNYRLNSLIAYNDFVARSPEKDFPLSQFKGRHNSSSQAVGYSKSMMFFHMLEFRLGKDVFRKALQDFYRKNIFKKASFQDIQKSFEALANQDLEVFFSQWLQTKGAPDLALSDVRIMHWHDGSYSTTYLLQQKQAQAYDLTIPVIWKLENGETQKQIARLNSTSQVYSFVSKSRPVEISVDPEFHVFRRLYTEERPATLSSVFGDPSLHFYYDTSNAAAALFTQKWAQVLEGKNTLHNANELVQPATEGALILVGDDTAFADFMKLQLQDQKFELSQGVLKIENQSFEIKDTSTVLVARLRNSPQQTVVWLRWSANNDPVEWAQRLIHYTTFGILVFKDRPVIYKSTWPTTSSPLRKAL